MFFVKSNFNTKKPSTIDELRKPIEQVDEQKGELNEKEFEELVSKTGAAGSFMIYRSEDKKSEMGIDEL